MDTSDIVFDNKLSASNDWGLAPQAQYRGKDCIVVTPNCKLAKRAVALCCIKSDLQACEGFIAEMNGASSVVREGLTRGLIITYGKCYAGQGARGLSLNRKKVFQDASEKLTDLHLKLINERNDFVAHASNENLERGAINIIFPPKGSDGPPAVNTIIQSFVSHAPTFLPMFSELINYVFDHVNAEYTQCIQALIEATKKEKGPDFFK